MDPNHRAVRQKYVSTGITELDTLLGSKGLRRGSTILLRGAPGTGKTTMALKIARHALREEEHSVVFITVDQRPVSALNQITDSLWRMDYESFLGEGRNERWDAIDLADYWEEFRRLIESHIQNELASRTPIGFSVSGTSGSDSPTIDEYFTDVKNVAQDVLKQCELNEVLAQLWEKIMGHFDPPLLVVIDSLDAMVHGAQFRFRSYDDRWMLLAALQSFEDWRWRYRTGEADPSDVDRSFSAEHSRVNQYPTVLLTSEDTWGMASTAAESYLTDVVIQLSRKSISQKVHLSPTEPVEWKEEKSFCKIDKGRGLPIQRRACCYEFAAAKEDEPPEKAGIIFYPTYAAQGFVSLFHENSPQKGIIENLRNIDIPATYPGVLVQEFSRSGLQRLFAIRRYAEQVPSRHPLLLANVDEYWVRVLGKAGLLHPIDRSRLKLYGIAQSEGQEGTNATTQVISELVDAKSTFYLNDRGDYLAVPVMANVGMLIYRKDLVDMPPKTWEELEALCGELKEEGKPHQFLIETQTYDTLIATALELGWGHGAFWHTKADGDRLRVEYAPNSSIDDLVSAIERLHNWIHLIKIVPKHSTVDPAWHSGDGWAFARHWYSTWIDVLTRRNESGQLIAPVARDAEYGIAPIPMSESRKQLLGEGAPHHSAWGEWYLAMQRGTENVDLGIELINNLTTSRKVTEAAQSGACLPTMEQFYKIYGPDICLGTDKSYKEVRQMFFPDAKSRIDFEDYRKLARVLYGVLHAVVTNERANVRQLITGAFRDLEDGIGTDR